MVIATDEGWLDIEFELEQRVVDRCHERVDRLGLEQWERNRANALQSNRGASAREVFDRDVLAVRTASRISQLANNEHGLVFGRLDGSDGAVLHVGRVGLRDGQHEPLLHDWRSAAAAPFYTATAADRQAIARRRVLTCDRRRVVELHDELLDPEVDLPVLGAGALMAALTRARDGRMHDIVSTIQREQHEVIQLPASGVLFVSGGPGTGKTVVALHRLAYLMYATGARRMLFVGPTRRFCEYVGHVLPSLGEHDVQLFPVAGLVEVDAPMLEEEAPDLVAVKGSERMIPLLEAVLRAALPGEPVACSVVFEGRVMRVDGEWLTRQRQQLLDECDTYADVRAGGRALLEDALLADMSEQLDEAEGWERDSLIAAGRERVVDNPRLDDFMRCWLPPLDAASLYERMRSGSDLDADGVLSAHEQELLQTAWSEGHHSTHDLVLLDELRARLGGPAVDREHLDHVVVDEAQDVTPMQWRLLARRAPYASWTLVGDWAQSALLETASAREAVRRLARGRRFTEARLSINYRTPSEIAEFATDLLLRSGELADIADAVRTSGRPVRVVAGASIRSEVDRLLAGGLGTVAVVAPPDHIADIRRHLDPTEGLVLLTPRQAKGLEFDRVLVVWPELVQGPRDVYVAMTRSTQELTVLHRGADAESLAPGRIGALG